jgi:glutaredoxin
MLTGRPGLIKSQSQPVVVFSKSTCPYCSRAKRTLADEFDPTLIKSEASLESQCHLADTIDQPLNWIKRKMVAPSKLT